MALRLRGQWEENTGKLKPCWAACHCWLCGRAGQGGGGVTGKPVFHLCLKSFILRSPKKLVFGSYGSGWFHTRSSLFLECPSLLSTPSHFSICLSFPSTGLSFNFFFPVGGEFFPAHRQGGEPSAPPCCDDTPQSGNPLGQGSCCLTHDRCPAPGTDLFGTEYILFT